MSMERAIFRDAMESAGPEPEPDPQPRPAKVLAIAATGPCHCGCGRPAGVSLLLDDAAVFIGDPGLADAIAGQLVAARERLWGPKP